MTTIEIYKNGFLWDKVQVQSIYQLATEINGIIEKNTFRAYFLMDCQKTFNEGGIYAFDMGEYIKIIK